MTVGIAPAALVGRSTLEPALTAARGGVARGVGVSYRFAGDRG